MQGRHPAPPRQRARRCGLFDGLALVPPVTPQGSAARQSQSVVAHRQFVPATRHAGAGLWGVLSARTIPGVAPILSTELLCRRRQHRHLWTRCVSGGVEPIHSSNAARGITNRCTTRRKQLENSYLAMPGTATRTRAEIRRRLAKIDSSLASKRNRGSYRRSGHRVRSRAKFSAALPRQTALPPACWRMRWRNPVNGRDALNISQ